MTVMALALARAREGDCDALEGSSVYDSLGERVGWVGQVMDESGYPCEHMGMGDEGYTSCWSSSEISRLREENEKLKQLVRHMYTCMEQVDGFGVYYDCENCALKDKCDECGLEERVRALGIEVDE